MNSNAQQAPGQDQQHDAHQRAMQGMMGSRKRPRSASVGVYGRPATAVQYPPHQQHALQQHNPADEIPRLLAERNNWHLNTFRVPMTMIEQMQFVHDAWQAALSRPAPAPPAHGALAPPQVAMNGGAPAPEDARAQVDVLDALGAPEDLNVRSQETQEKIAQLKTEIEELKIYNKAEKVKNRILAECDEEMSSKIKKLEEALEEKQKKIEEGIQLREQKERENQELKERLGEVQRGEEQGEALSPRVQTPPSQAPLNVRSQKTQEEIAQLNTEIEKLETDTEARKIVNQALWECKKEMDSKIKKLEEALEEKQKKIEEGMQFKEQVERENQELRRRLGEVELEEETDDKNCIVEGAEQSGGSKTVTAVGACSSSSEASTSSSSSQEDPEANRQI